MKPATRETTSLVLLITSRLVAVAFATLTVYHLFEGNYGAGTVTGLLAIIYLKMGEK